MYNKQLYIKFAPLYILIIGGVIGTFYMLQTNDLVELSRFWHIGHSIFITLGLWIGCFFITSYLWKKYPWEFHPIKHLTVEFVAIILYTNLFCWAVYSLGIYCKVPNFSTQNQYLNYEILLTNLITIIVTLIHEAVFFYRQWKFNFSKSIQLEKDNLEAKYETLKSQVNPHFLFNSLNSLSYIVDDNAEAQTYIQNLSDFLRYGMQNRNAELVPLTDELEMVAKYISLQKTRFGDNLIILKEIHEASQFFIPPFVVQMLVENCIKHNIISKEKKLHIYIRIQQDTLIVENNLQKRMNPESIGHGLSNIEHRYSYFTDKTIEIEEKNDLFTVIIPLIEMQYD